MNNKTLYYIMCALAIICFIVGIVVVLQGDNNSYYAVFCGGLACLFAALYYQKKMKDENKK